MIFFKKLFQPFAPLFSKNSWGFFKTLTVEDFLFLLSVIIKINGIFTDQRNQERTW
jgi:hypothetical protein